MFWYEWFPTIGGQNLSNPAVGPGEACEVILSVMSPVRGNVHLANLATGIATQFDIIVPDVPANHVATDTGEWILERLDPNWSGFPFFSPTFYWDSQLRGAWFTDGSGASISQGTLLSMAEGGNTYVRVQSLGSFTGDALSIVDGALRP